MAAEHRLRRSVPVQLGRRVANVFIGKHVRALLKVSQDIYLILFCICFVHEYVCMYPKHWFMTADAGKHLVAALNGSLFNCPRTPAVCSVSVRLCPCL